MSVSDEDKIKKIMSDAGCGLYGVAAFGELRGGLIGCSGLRRLPEKAASVIVCAFPYFTGIHPDANISKYAMPEDYHIVVGGMLRAAVQSLAAAFPAGSFVPFCDASPIPEVEAARLAGIGAVGRSGLIITNEYGSYVFIGEIVTDLVLKPSKPAACGCLGCGICERLCPGGALVNGEVDRTRCLSAVTQKKGVLSAEETALVKRGGSAWGCDICQDVCPLNRGAALTEIAAFRRELVTRLEENDAFDDKYPGRAFMWKGAAVLRRNLGIIAERTENNNTTP
jgi:epoxyqueuosine reductase